MKILLAAGGTGGHIWPAISFAKWMVAKQPDSEVRFVCGSRPVEDSMFSHAGIKPFVLPMEGSPLWGSLRTKAQRWKGLLRSFHFSRKILKEWKPDVCLVFGGYISIPVILASLSNRTPVVLHEQNARAGKVTRFAVRLGIPVFSGWERCLPLSNCEFAHVGVPVRRMTCLPPGEAWNKLGFNMPLPPPPVILVLGGSLGSDPLADLFGDACSLKLFADWSILLVGTGMEVVRAAPNLWILPREWNIDLLYSLADVAVARAGASTLSELVVFGLPSVIIPWRGASDDHQMENAMIFCEQGHGSIWEIDNGVLQNLSFMIDYEHKRARLGQAIFGPKKNSDVCEKLWNHVLHNAEGRGLN
ncbi:MAG: UDP-N-acetylglucosamine--N-acetylmuramyl-(pentapeptide) pyrophosphoryl-undecaprenol N-acetylglucosamine transferase [Thermovirgaceae bacterium]|nr:UDP-N-acetylglucosamine--N-acetylmuramyl-(pentapeptide) pyrophosphoryl-undecaprenol N-acetylglucosamine transferase [Thermovirgaceae bacterium]